MNRPGFILLTAVAILIFLFSNGISASTSEKGNDEEKIDFVAMAVRLCSDGHYQRALKVLDQIDISDESLDLITYYTIRGMAEARSGNYQAAVDAFRESITHGQTDPGIYVYLANLYFKLNRYEEAVKAVNHAGGRLVSDPRLLLLKAESYWRLNRHPETFNTLDVALEIFPDRPVFERQKFYYFLQMNLYSSAIKAAERFLSKGNPSVDDYIAVANALMSSNQIDNAIIFLNKARLIYPDNQRVYVALANLYFKQHHYLTGAMLFERLSISDPSYAGDAAELYRRSQQYFHALYLNSKVPDQKAKIRQKLAILLDMKAFERIAAMKLVLSRTGLLDDDSIRYAYAYALFYTGDYETAEKYLKKINRREIFQKATGLREMIEKCKREPGKC